MLCPTASHLIIESNPIHATPPPSKSKTTVMTFFFLEFALHEVLTNRLHDLHSTTADSRNPELKRCTPKYCTIARYSFAFPRMRIEKLNFTSTVTVQNVDDLSYLRFFMHKSSLREESVMSWYQQLLLLLLLGLTQTQRRCEGRKSNCVTSGILSTLPSHTNRNCTL